MGSLALNISFMTYGLAAMAYAVLFGLLIDKKQYKEENIWLSVAVLASILWGFIHVIDAVAGAYTTNIVLLTLSYLVPFIDWLKGVLWALFLYNHLRHIWNSQGNQNYSKNAGMIIATFIGVGFFIEGANFASQWGLFDRDIVGRLPLFNKLLVSFSILLLVENLYRNIASENRWGVRFFCLGLGSIYAFNFLLYSD
ncbi:MAG TPA: hypothetical protein PK690_01675, partial [Emcibacteraceae bacterium]|nr:hypothetical protein [Emcibacteraceae bacterium]